MLLGWQRPPQSLVRVGPRPRTIWRKRWESTSHEPSSSTPCWSSSRLRARMARFPPPRTRAHQEFGSSPIQTRDLEARPRCHPIRGLTRSKPRQARRGALNPLKTRREQKPKPMLLERATANGPDGAQDPTRSCPWHSARKTASFGRDHASSGDDHASSRDRSGFRERFRSEHAFGPGFRAGRGSGASAATARRPDQTTTLVDQRRRHDRNVGRPDGRCCARRRARGRKQRVRRGRSIRRRR